MNKKTLMTLGSLLAIILCIGTIVAWGTYMILSIPSIKQGLQTAGGELNAMIDLRETILESYPSQDVSVQLMNGNTLDILLINSEMSNLSSAEQSKNAREIALFVNENYTGQVAISDIVITFMQNNRIGQFYVNRSMSYPFEVSELH